MLLTRFDSFLGHSATARRPSRPSTSAAGGGNAFGTVAVSGQSDVVADASADTLTLAAGTGITLTVEGTNFGDPSDHTLEMDDCRCTIDFSEGDPSSFTINFEVLGTITAT